MKLVIATPIYPPDIGGPATYLSQFVPFLESRGVEVSIVTMSDTDHEPAVDGRLVRILRSGSRIGRFVKYYRALRARARESDLMYVHDMSGVGLAAYIASFGSCPYLLRLGGDFVWEQAFENGVTNRSYTDFQGHESGLFKLRRLLGTRIARRARVVIVPSMFLRDIVVSWGIEPTRVMVAHNTVEQSQAADSEVVRKFLDTMHAARARGKKVIVSAGRFVRWKHFDVLLEAVAAVDTVHLVLVGSGPEEDTYRAYVAQNRLADRVSVVGVVSRDSLNAIFRACDCFMLLSEGETFSFVSLEALSAGTPVVLLRRAALQEIFGVWEGRGVSFLESYDREEVMKALLAIPALPTPDATVRSELARTYDRGRHFSIVYDAMQRVAEKA